MISLYVKFFPVQCGEAHLPKCRKYVPSVCGMHLREGISDTAWLLQEMRLMSGNSSAPGVAPAGAAAMSVADARPELASSGECAAPTASARLPVAFINVTMSEISVLRHQPNNNQSGSRLPESQRRLSRTVQRRCAAAAAARALQMSLDAPKAEEKAHYRVHCSSSARWPLCPSILSSIAVGFHCEARFVL